MFATAIKAKTFLLTVSALTAALSVSGCSHTSVTKASANEVEEECARVSVFFPPPKTKRLFRAAISNINGDNVNLETFTFKLPPGKHELLVMHHITEPLRMRSAARNITQNGKVIEVELAANTTYHIGAKFISTERYKTRKQEFWEPVIWKTEDNTCLI